MAYLTSTYIALAALAASAAGAGISAYSAQQQGQAQERLNEYNAKLNEQNAATAQRDAAISANAQRAKNAKVLAFQRAAFAANGVAVDTGSPLLVQAQTAANLEMGALETQRLGNIQASNDAQQAALDRMAGRAARASGNLNATFTILQGAGSIGSSAAGLNYKTVK